MMAMLCKSETWCLREMANLRTDTVTIRANCGIKLIQKRNSQKFTNLLCLKETLGRLINANEVRWYGHALRKGDNDVLRKPLDFEVVGRIGYEQPKTTWRRQVEQFGLK